MKVLLLLGMLGWVLVSGGSYGSHERNWTLRTDSLLKEAHAGQSISLALARLFPELKRQIDSDSKVQEWKNLWGQSLNFDENAGGIIVERTVIEALSKAMRVAAPHDRVVHAGTEHTYGYLLSQLKTPFGYKRTRWIQNEIELGFGLPKETLSPETPQGTLFSNVTFFIGNIAFRNQPENLKALWRFRSRVPASLRRYPYSALKVSRIEERVGEIKLWTDLIPFQGSSSASGDSYLLIYSIQERAQAAPKLITAFPIQLSFAQSLMDPKTFGSRIPITTRYNGFISGLSGKTVLGTRRLILTAL